MKTLTVLIFAAAGVLSLARASSRPQITARNVRVVVSADGTADFPTIQRAVDHAPAEGDGRLIIAIKPGVYQERIAIPQDRPRVTLIGLGEHPSDVVIRYSMSATAAGGTFFSSIVDVQSEGFEAANLTIQNTFGPGSQAVALALHSDKATVRQCRLLGWQDTLYVAAGRQYFDECYIEGAVDFIFGNAQAVFDRSEIRSAGDGYITAQSRTNPDGSTGFVFDHCKLTHGATEKGAYLGRPWRPYARVVFLDCSMDDHIRPEGWDNWRDPANEKTAWFAEYHSSGPGADASKRVPWSRQLTAEQAPAFAATKFLAGADGWNPHNSDVSKTDHE